MKRLSMMLFVVVVLAAGTAFAAGGAEGASGKTVVTFWNGYTGPDRPAVEEIVARFNESQDAISVEMEIAPWDSLFQKLMPAFIAGTGPDLIGFDVSRVAEYVEANRLEPLNAFISESDLGPNNLVTDVLEASTIDGNLYGVPMGFASMIMYYNRAHFEDAGLDPDSPPATMAELKNAWEELVLTDTGGNVERYPQSFGIRATVPMIPVVFWAFGGQIIADDGSSGLNSPQALEAMTFLRDAVVDIPVSPVGLTGQEADNLFAAGRASIEWNGPWAINGFRDAGIDLGMAELPTGPAGRYTWGGGTVIVMNKDSEAKDAAWQFMEYWNSRDIQAYWAETVAFPPTRTDITGLTEKNPDLVPFVRAANYAKIFLAGQTKAGRIESEVLTPLCERVFSGQVSPAEALAEAHQLLSGILSE